MDIAHNGKLQLSETLKSSITTYKSVRDEILYQEDVFPEDKPMNLVDFASYILTNGNIQEKRDLIIAIGKQLYIKNEFVTSNPH